MYYNVKSVTPMPEHRIRVELENGMKGIFDVTPYLDHGVFRELRDLVVEFAQGAEVSAGIRLRVDMVE